MHQLCSIEAFWCAGMQHHSKRGRPEFDSSTNAAADTPELYRSDEAAAATQTSNDDNTDFYGQLSFDVGGDTVMMDDDATDYKDFLTEIVL